MDLTDRSKTMKKALLIFIATILGAGLTVPIVAVAVPLMEKLFHLSTDACVFWTICIVFSLSVFFCNWLMLTLFKSKKAAHEECCPNLPVMVLEHIDEIIKAMGYRRKIRQEVRDELLAHFTDALADCESDGERNETAQNLIAEFGDAKLLGKLMRRGKKRCRPLWRRMVARTIQAVGAMVLLLALYLGWFFSGKPVITTNYLDVLNRQVRPVADANQNAWPFYKQAAEKYVKPEDKHFDMSLRPFAELSDADRGTILQLIKDNQESLDLIRQGNQKPYYWQVYGAGENKSNELISVLLPHLSDYRSLARLLNWQAVLAAEQGNMQQAFDHVLEIYSLGQRLRGQNTTLIEQLVAMSIENLSTDTMRMLLDESMQNIDAPLLDSVKKRFGEMVSKANFTISFESEKLFFYDEIQRSFTQSRIGKSHIYIQRVGQLGMGMGGDGPNVINRWLRLLFTHPDREQTRQAVDHVYAEMSQLAVKTPASLHKEGVSMDEVAHDLTQNNIMLQILMPALGKVTQLSYRCQADTVATLTIFAILQYHKTHNVYPDSLDVLVQSGLLVQLPMDSFSDAPLVYRKTETGFTLYSVGLNFTDDGGVSEKNNKGKPTLWDDKDGDAVFWPKEKD
jgi:hypothetical protein